MAQDFENVKARNIGTSASTLLTANSDDALTVPLRASLLCPHV